MFLACCFAHEYEHGVGGGQEFGFGDVADDFGVADGGGEDEGADAAAVFLVACGEGYQFFGGGFEWGEWAVAEDQIYDAVGIFLGEGVAGVGYVERGD